jgi:thioredoxin 1
MSQVFHVNDSNFEAEVMQHQELPVLVDFSATWCGPCKKLEPIIDEIAGDYAGRVKVAKVDVDQARQTAARFGVMAVPTVMLFHNGAVKEQIRGLVSKRALSDKLDKVL